MATAFKAAPGCDRRRLRLNAFARSWEGEPPGEPRRCPARTEPRPPRITQGRLAQAAGHSSIRLRFSIYRSTHKDEGIKSWPSTRSSTPKKSSEASSRISSRRTARRRPSARRGLSAGTYGTPGSQARDVLVMHMDDLQILVIGHVDKLTDRLEKLRLSRERAAPGDLTRTGCFDFLNVRAQPLTESGEGRGAVIHADGKIRCARPCNQLVFLLDSPLTIVPRTTDYGPRTKRMCGIAGFVNRSGLQADRAIVECMTATLTHRGPDGDGIYVNGQVALGHRRLSIIDVAGGSQPMSNEDGSVWVSYNGELYNEQELRKELEGKLHRYRTSCDTETLVHLYEEEGPEFVCRLNGMFALAIWDCRRSRLVLARDRMGQKPLYYASLPGGGLAFGSEPKAILAHPEISRALDRESLARYLFYEYVPAPASIWRSIRKLKSGHVLTWECSEYQVSRYWNAPAMGSSPRVISGPRPPSFGRNSATL